jgi:hypothetical protein
MATFADMDSSQPALSQSSQSSAAPLPPRSRLWIPRAPPRAPQAAPAAPTMATASDDVVNIPSYRYRSPTALVILRFARLLAGATKRHIDEVMPRERIIWLNNHYENDDYMIEQLLKENFDNLYRFLFTEVHYIIERTRYAIMQRMNRPVQLSLLHLIGDEQSLIHFVALCNVNWHRLRLESGVNFANNQAILLFEQEQEHHFAFYGRGHTFDVSIASTEDRLVYVRASYRPAIEEAVYKAYETNPYWFLLMIIHQGMRRAQWSLQSVMNAHPSDWQELVRDPVSWAAFLDGAVSTAIINAYSLLRSSTSFSAAMAAISASRDSCWQFANLVGTTYHLKQFQQSLHKRPPIVKWLVQQQMEMVSLLN